MGSVYVYHRRCTAKTSFTSGLKNGGGTIEIIKSQKEKIDV